MHAMPRTTMGRRALWLLVPVLLYMVLPLYRLVPDSPRALSIAVGFAIIGLAFASLITAGIAIFRDKERSVLVLVLGALAFLGVAGFTIGELVGGH